MPLRLHNGQEMTSTHDEIEVLTEKVTIEAKLVHHRLRSCADTPQTKAENPSPQRVHEGAQI